MAWSGAHKHIPLNDEMRIEFPAINPQIQATRISKCKHIWRHQFDKESLAHYQISLILNSIWLLIWWQQMALQQRLEEDAVHLCGLQNLWRLHGVGYFHRMSASWPIDSLADNNIAIGDLQIDRFNPRIVDNVARLTSIQSLQLERFFTFEMIFDLILKLPAVADLRIHSCEQGWSRLIRASTNKTHYSGGLGSDWTIIRLFV